MSGASSRKPRLPKKPVAGKYPAGIACKCNLLPFVGVEWEHKRTFPNGKRAHIIAYRAYNAMGLIGSECNGVAVVALPSDRRRKGGQVITDELGCISSGWSGLTQEQLDLAYKLAVCTWEEFSEIVNASPKRRCMI